MIKSLIKKVVNLLTKMDKTNWLFIVLAIFMMINIWIFNYWSIHNQIDFQGYSHLKKKSYTELSYININNNLSKILLEDSLSTRVILLGYSNEVEESGGFKYKYIIFISEKYRKNLTSCENKFYKLNLVNYYEELDKINSKDYVVIDTSSTEYPKLCNKIKECNSYKATLIPVKSNDKILGLIIIFLDSSSLNGASPKNAYVNKIGMLMDYDYLKKYTNDEDW